MFQIVFRKIGQKSANFSYQIETLQKQSKHYLSTTYTNLPFKIIYQNGHSPTLREECGTQSDAADLLFELVTVSEVGISQIITIIINSLR